MFGTSTVRFECVYCGCITLQAGKMLKANTSSMDLQSCPLHGLERKYACRQIPMMQHDLSQISVPSQLSRLFAVARILIGWFGVDINGYALWKVNITLPKAILPCQKQYYPGKININLGEGNPRMPQPIREQHLFLAHLIWQKTPYLAKDPKGVPQTLSFVNKPFRCNARIVITANLS